MTSVQRYKDLAAEMHAWALRETEHPHVKAEWELLADYYTCLAEAGGDETADRRTLRRRVHLHWPTFQH
jgi:hypothetical protein